MTYLLSLSENDLQLIFLALTNLSRQQLFGGHASRAAELAEDLERLKERQDAA